VKIFTGFARNGDDPRFLVVLKVAMTPFLPHLAPTVEAQAFEDLTYFHQSIGPDRCFSNLRAQVASAFRNGRLGGLL